MFPPPRSGSGSSIFVTTDAEIEATEAAIDLASSKLGGEEEDAVEIPESEDDNDTDDVALDNGVWIWNPAFGGSKDDFLCCGEVNPPKVFTLPPPAFLFLHTLEALLRYEGAENDSVASLNHHSMEQIQVRDYILLTLF